MYELDTHTISHPAKKRKPNCAGVTASSALAGLKKEDTQTMTEMTTVIDVQIARLVARARTKNNPVYLWEAVKLCLDPPFGPPRPLPAPCADYLAEVARRITRLGHLEHYEPDKPRLNARAAKNLLPEAIGLGKQGRNLFKNRYADHERETLGINLLTRDPRKTPGEVVESLKRRRGLKTTRSAQREAQLARESLSGYGKVTKPTP